MPVNGTAMKLVRATLGDHADISGARELGGVAAGNDIDFLHDMDVRGLQGAAVARNSVDGGLHLLIGLTGELNAVDAGGGLHQRQRGHDRLRVAAVTDPGGVIEALACECTLDFGGVGGDQGGVGADRHFRADGPELECHVDAADLRVLKDYVIGDEGLEARVSGGQSIGTAGEVGHFVLAGAVAGDDPLDVGSQIDDFELGATDRRAGGISD